MTTSPASVARRRCSSASTRPARSSSRRLRGVGERAEQQRLLDGGGQGVQPAADEPLKARGQRLGALARPSCGRRTHRPAPGRGTGCPRSRGGSGSPSVPAGRADRAGEASSSAPSGGTSSQVDADGSSDAGRRPAAQRPATTRRTPRPARRRTAKPSTSTDEASSHCASSSRTRTGARVDHRRSTSHHARPPTPRSPERLPVQGRAILGGQDRPRARREAAGRDRRRPCRRRTSRPPPRPHGARAHHGRGRRRPGRPGPTCARSRRAPSAPPRPPTRGRSRHSRGGRHVRRAGPATRCGRSWSPLASHAPPIDGSGGKKSCHRSLRPESEQCVPCPVMSFLVRPRRRCPRP